MPTARRKCKLAVSDHKEIDLCQFEDIIIRTVNATVPGKNPKVCKNYFSTDLLTQSEAVSLGRALAKIEELKVYGKSVTIFRLFDGKVYESETAVIPINKKQLQRGGRMR